MTRFTLQLVERVLPFNPQCDDPVRLAIALAKEWRRFTRSELADRIQELLAHAPPDGRRKIQNAFERACKQYRTNEDRLLTQGQRIATGQNASPVEEL